MAKLINLVGQRFGKLVVIERDVTKKGTYWICKCDCGNIISTRVDTLTRAKNPKQCCGCDLARRNSEAHIKNEIGKRYGYLTVIKRIDSKRAAARWLCQCDCGNFTEVDGSHLRNNSVQSCGCKRHEGNNGFDEMGKIYGKLTVIDRASNRENNSHRYWVCKCECGNIIEVQGTYLRNGCARHCGCESSAGEHKIHSLLSENNILFKRQLTFPDLLGDEGARLRYDFGIIDSNNNLKYIIEYDGIQHFEVGHFGNTEEDLKKIQKYDIMKNEYCKNNNIPLIRINYKNFEKFTIADLQPETSLYVVNEGE